MKNNREYLLEKREFYGPLEIIDDIETPDHLTLYQHPEDPGRLVRMPILVDEYENPEISNTLEMLKNFDAFNIPYVCTDYFKNDEYGREFGMVVERINGAVSVERLLESEQLTDDQFREIDHLILKLAHYLEFAIENDEVMSYEFLHPRQFVYVEEGVPGAKCILVDTEPFHAKKYSAEKYQAATALQGLIEEAGYLLDRRQNEQLHCVPMLQKAIDALKENPPEDMYFYNNPELTRLGLKFA